MSWRDEAEPVKTSNWKDEAEPVVTGTEALARSVGQGFFGLGDEIEGAAKAASDIAGPKYELSQLLDRYRTNRDQARKDNAKSYASHPNVSLAGEVGTGLGLSFVPGLNAAKGASLASKLGLAAGQGAAYGLGTSDADLTEGDVTGAAKDALISAGTGAALTGAGEKLPSFLKYIGDKSKVRAGRLAESATGATRKMAEGFKKGTGVDLLDNGFVRLFDSPGDIAKRTQGAMDTAGDEMGIILKSLTDDGVAVTPDAVISRIDESIEALRGQGSGHSDQVAQLENIKGNISKALGSDPVGLDIIEKEKRSYGKVNWKDEDKAMARKSAYRTLRGITEDVAEDANPELAAKFSENKKMYGLLDPVQEAAEKRDLQLNQSPWGGLLDTAAFGAAGATYGGSQGNGTDDALKYGLGASVGRRFIAPRLKSTAAVGFNNISKLLGSAPVKAGANALKNVGGKAPYLQHAAENYVGEKQAADDYINRR